MAALRSLLAFPVLLGWARLRGLRLVPSRRELLLLALSGTLLWTGGNALVVVAEQHVDSGLAALLVASTPIWVAVLESLLDRRLPSLLATAGLCLGFVGTALVAYPSLRQGGRSDVIAVLLLLLGALCWSGGSLLQRRRPIGLDPMVSAAYQMLFGGLGVAVFSLSLQEPLPHPTPTAWAAFAYLFVFGSIISFTSFLKALRLLPTRLVFTYGFVNPVLAAFLGWAALGEHLPREVLLGALLVLVGVAGSFRAKD
jgi:drug/metabolite transporter (DMT)-like permease